MKKILLIMMMLVSVAAAASAKVADDRFVVGGVSIGQTKSQVETVCGEPVKTRSLNEFLFYEYGKNNETELVIRFRNGIADTVYVAGNKDIATLDGIKIGSAKKKIIKTYGEPDDHQRGTGFVSHPDAELIRYLSVNGNMRMTFEVMHGKVLNFDIERFVSK